MNYITLHGYLGRDPELKDKMSSDGRAYKSATFSVGVSRSYGDQVDWFYCIINGKRAEVIEKYFHKGSQILLQGRMESYKDKDNDKITRWSVNVTDFDFCDKNPSGQQSRAAAAPAQETMEEVTEDVPF